MPITRPPPLRRQAVSAAISRPAVRCSDVPPTDTTDGSAPGYRGPGANCPKGVGRTRTAGRWGTYGKRPCTGHGESDDEDPPRHGKVGTPSHADSSIGRWNAQA